MNTKEDPRTDLSGNWQRLSDGKALRVSHLIDDRWMRHYSDGTGAEITREELLRDFKRAPITLKAGVYKHYKGGLYQAIGIGRHTETEELMVAYIALTGAHLSGPRLNFRPAAMWFEQVEVDGKKVPRFEYIGIEAKQES